jgi:hypothetical protein
LTEKDLNPIIRAMGNELPRTHGNSHGLSPAVQANLDRWNGHDVGAKAALSTDTTQEELDCLKDYYIQIGMLATDALLTPGTQNILHSSHFTVKQNTSTAPTSKIVHISFGNTGFPFITLENRYAPVSDSLPVDYLANQDYSSASFLIDLNFYSAGFNVGSAKNELPRRNREKILKPKNPTPIVNFDGPLIDPEEASSFSHAVTLLRAATTDPQTFMETVYSVSKSLLPQTNRFGQKPEAIEQLRLMENVLGIQPDHVDVERKQVALLKIAQEIFKRK